MSIGFLSVPETGPNEVEHRRQIARGANLALQGKLNATFEATLGVSTTETVIEDARVTHLSFISLQPLTLNAAGSFSTTWVSSQTKGSFTLAHSSSSATDRTFRILIIG